jgi:molybdate transport system regulatory protein
LKRDNVYFNNFCLKNEFLGDVNITKVNTSVEYRITIGENSFLLDEKKYLLLDYINNLGSIRAAANELSFSYRTALNYIKKMESSLNVSVIETQKGGSGGGGSSSLTEEGLKILRECKKINAIMELHREVNELEAELVDIDYPRGVMKIRMKTIDITIPLNNKYKIGDRLLALISYDNIFIMNSLQKSSIRNNFKGTIVELTLIEDMIRAKVDVDGVIFYSDITLSASKELDLILGQEVYIGFKALAIATLKLN